MPLFIPESAFYIGPWVSINAITNVTISLSFQQNGILLRMAPTRDILVIGYRVHIQGATASAGKLTTKLAKNGLAINANYDFDFINQAVDPSFVGGIFTAPPVLYTPNDLLGFLQKTDVAWNSNGADLVIYALVREV